MKSVAEKFIYDEDYEFYQQLLIKHNLELQAGEKTIDAQIMDLADEIAYAAHDLEDALSRNMVTIEDIEYEFFISEKYKDALPDFKEIVKKSKETAAKADSMKSSEEFAMIFRKELTSNIVNRLVMDISVVMSKHGFEELGFEKLQKLSEGLKKLLFKVIMRKRNILTYEFRGNEIIADLYEFYNQKDNFKFLSPELKFAIPEENSADYTSKKARAVVDYISGMMDTFAIKEWETHCKK